MRHGGRISLSFGGDPGHYHCAEQRRAKLLECWNQHQHLNYLVWAKDTDAILIWMLSWDPQILHSNYREDDVMWNVNIDGIAHWCRAADWSVQSRYSLCAVLIVLTYHI